MSVPLGKRGNFIEALLSAQVEAAKRAEARVVALKNKALVLEKLGRNEEALVCYEEMLKLTDNASAQQMGKAGKERLATKTSQGAGKRRPS